jgi:TPR repeat protein
MKAIPTIFFLLSFFIISTKANAQSCSQFPEKSSAYQICKLRQENNRREFDQNYRAPESSVTPNAQQETRNQDLDRRFDLMKKYNEALLLDQATPNDAPSKKTTALAAERAKAALMDQIVNRGILEFRAGNAIDAVKYFSQAASEGDPRAQGYLALIYSAGQPGVPKDPNKAMNFALKAAEQGNLIGLIFTAAAYKNGSLGTAKNPEKARQALLATRVAPPLEIAEIDTKLRKMAEEELSGGVSRE